MAPSKYIALSRLPVNSLAPVKNKFPTEADWKSNTEVGRSRLRISRLMATRKDRMSSRFEDEMPVHRGCWTSSRESHSMRAVEGRGERRWLKKALMAIVSGKIGEDGIRRTRRPGYVRSWYGDMKNINHERLTPHITYAWSSKDSNQLARASSIVTDWDDTATPH